MESVKEIILITEEVDWFKTYCSCYHVNPFARFRFRDGGFRGGGAKASLGSSPAAIIIYKNPASKSPNADYDCGLATQNMVIAAASLGYGVKIVSSPTMTLNGSDHDAICEKLGVDPSMQAVAVLLIGRADETVDATTSASTRDDLETKTNIIE